MSLFRKSSLIAAFASIAVILSVVISIGDDIPTYNALNLFGDVFERVRMDYVDPVDDIKLIEAAIDGLYKVPGINSRPVNDPHFNEGKSLPPEDKRRLYSALNYFGNTFERIKREDGKNIENRVLIEAAINGMLRSLDTRSFYTDAERFVKSRTPPPTGTGGIGVEIAINNGQVKVVRPIKGGPAANAGILCGDIIVAVDSVSLKGLSLEDVVRKLTGPLNTQITLSMLVAGRGPEVELRLTRQVIYVRSVESSIEDDVGYIRISQFNEKTRDGIGAAINDIQARIPPDKLKGYVLDLRGNQGGLFDPVITVADLFLVRGEILSTRGRDKSSFQRFNARPNDLTLGKKLIVLIDEVTGSGAEIMAAALQEHNRAKIVGTRSYGHAAIHTVIPLGSGKGALTLMTARIYPPSGRNINGVGVEPDVHVTQPDQTGTSAPGCQSDHPTSRLRDTQFQTALSLLRK